MNFVAIQMNQTCPDVQVIKLEHLIHMYQFLLPDFSRLPINYLVRDRISQKLIGVSLSFDYIDSPDDLKIGI